MAVDDRPTEAAAALRVSRDDLIKPNRRQWNKEVKRGRESNRNGRRDLYLQRSTKKHDPRLIVLKYVFPRYDSRNAHGQRAPVALNYEE